VLEARCDNPQPRACARDVDNLSFRRRPVHAFIRQGLSSQAPAMNLSSVEVDGVFVSLRRRFDLQRDSTFPTVGALPTLEKVDIGRGADSPFYASAIFGSELQALGIGTFRAAYDPAMTTNMSVWLCRSIPPYESLTQ